MNRSPSIHSRASRRTSSSRSSVAQSRPRSLSRTSSNKSLTAVKTQDDSSSDGSLRLCRQPTPPRQSKIVILIRHGESESNALKFVTLLQREPGKHDPNRFPDPALSEKGLMQAAAISANYPEFWLNLVRSKAVIWTSPMIRAVQTTLEAFPALTEPPQKSSQVPVEVWPDLQETFPLPTVGSSQAVLRKKFPQAFLDFSPCVEGWNIQSGKNDTTPAAVAQRLLEVRLRLLARPEPVIVLVGHGLFFLKMIDAPPGEKWENTELRAYTFGQDVSQAKLQKLSPDRAAIILGKKPISATEILRRWA